MQWRNGNDELRLRSATWSMESGREVALPISSGKSAFLEKFSLNKNYIILSETGTGKSTQIPQYFHCINPQWRIACTQPRRVAAISLARHVSKTYKCTNKRIVGYKVRFEDSTSEDTRICYYTDGALLRESVTDHLLTRFDVVILDEAHERSLHTDILFGVTKRAQSLRKSNGEKPLRIVLMSATINVEKFIVFFEAEVIYVEGRNFPVDQYYTTHNPKDYFAATFSAIKKIHSQFPNDGTLLVFLTGQDEIESMKYLLESDEELNCEMNSGIKLKILTLFASLPTPKQLDVMKSAESGTRKIILSTNIAETSVTIPSVRYVLDSGMVKIKEFNEKTGMETLTIKPISRAQAIQRSGRAGRLGPGFCFRLFTEETYFKGLLSDSVPEIKRSELSSVILQLMALKISDPFTFPWIEPISSSAVSLVLKKLTYLGAIADESNPKLTDLGKLMVKLPLSPYYSRAVILSCTKYRCSDEVSTIVALLSEENLVSHQGGNSKFQENKSHGRDFGYFRSKYHSKDGDLLSLLNMWEAVSGLSSDGSGDLVKWCQRTGINFSAFINARKAKSQICRIITESGLKLIFGRKNSDWGRKQLSENVRKALLSGLFMNCAQYNIQEKCYFTTEKKQRVFIHPSSCLFSTKPSLIMYTEVITTTKNYLRNVTVIDQATWLYDACPKLYENLQKDFQSFNSKKTVSDSNVYRTLYN